MKTVIWPQCNYIPTKQPPNSPPPHNPTCYKTIRWISCTAIFILLAINSFSETTHSLNIQIIDYGIYSAKTERVVNEPLSPTGQSRELTVSLTKQTHVIPAIIETKFGFRFQINSERREATNCLRFEFTFPPMTNPTNGKTSTNFAAIGYLTATAGTQGMFWDFVHPWEMNPGEWSMMIYSEGRLLAKKTFTVVHDKSAKKNNLEPQVAKPQLKLHTNENDSSNR